MLQLGLHSEHSFYNNLLDFYPNLICLLGGLASRAGLGHLASQTLWYFEFVLVVVEVVVSFVQTVIGQVDKVILHVFLGVFFGGKTD